MKRWAGVIGSPIEHSLSPILHDTAFGLLGLDWEYRKYRVETDELATFIAGVGADCVGLSVTSPLKRAVLPLVDATDGLANLVEAANTVAFSSAMSAAFNTDVQAIVDTVRPHLVAPSVTGSSGLGLLVPENAGPLTSLPPAVVVGTGATACSALAALKSLGATKVYLVGRSFAGPQNAYVIGMALGLEVHSVLLRVVDRYLPVLNAAPVLISTVPPAATVDLASNLTPLRDGVLLDVTYSSGQTPLENRFVHAGAQVTSPLTMLTLQGIAQVKIWTSEDVPFDPVHKAVTAARQ